MKKRILVIDDDEILRALVCRRLAFPAYILESAACGRQGRRLIESRGYDLVITDFHLPDTNAAELMAEVKKGFPHIPFFVISGDLAGRERELSDAGAQGCFPKPLNWDSLKANVRRILFQQCPLKRY
jgi:DNA-binding NtrC family response regulator